MVFIHHTTFVRGSRCGLQLVAPCVAAVCLATVCDIRCGHLGHAFQLVNNVVALKQVQLAVLA